MNRLPRSLDQRLGLPSLALTARAPRLSRVWAALVGLSLLSGCSVSLTAVPVSPKAREEMGRTKGIPYYMPRPYLLVTRNVELSEEDLAAAGMPAGPGTAAVGSLRERVEASSGAVRSMVPTSPSAPAAGEPVGTLDEGISAVGGPASSLAVKAGQVVPTYRMQVVYLPDLARQYALQQHSGPFASGSVKYELEGGWLFKGTEITQENVAGEIISATTSGVASILGTSLEQVFASLFPIPTEDYGVSSVGGSAGLDLSPRIWLFEIDNDAQGRLSINMKEPFFEWPPRETRATRAPIGAGAGGRDPESSDVSLPSTGGTKPSTGGASTGGASTGGTSTGGASTGGSGGSSLPPPTQPPANPGAVPSTQGGSAPQGGPSIR